MPIRPPRDKVRMPPSGITERSEVTLQGATVFSFGIPNRGCGVFRVLQGENLSRTLKSPSMPIRLPRDKVRMPPSGITERSGVTLQGATVFLIFLFCLRGAPPSPHAYIQLPASFRIQSDAFSCIFLANMLLLIYKCQKRQKEFLSLCG